MHPSICSILGDPGADSGAEDENQSGREKIRRAKVRKKNTSPWGQLFTHQFQTAERILAPDWAEKFSAQSGASIHLLLLLWMAEKHICIDGIVKIMV